MALTPWGQLKLKAANAAQQAGEKLRNLGATATEVAVRAEIEELFHRTFSNLSREQLDDPDVLAMVAIVLSYIPKPARRLGAESLEHYALTRRDFKRSFTGMVLRNAFAGAVEGTDSGIRELMERESFTTEEMRVALVRGKDKLLAQFAEEQKKPEHKTKESTVDNSKTDDKKDETKGDSAPAKKSEDGSGIDPRHMKGWTKVEVAMFMAMFSKAIEESRSDTAYTGFSGVARMALDGAGKLLEADASWVRTLLPTVKNGDGEEEITWELLETVRNDPFSNVQALTFIHMSIFTYVRTTKRYIPPHIADWLDSIVDLHAFKRWVAAQRAKLKEGETVQLPKPEAPAWVKSTLPFLQSFWDGVVRGEILLADYTLWTAIRGAACLLLGGAGVVICAIMSCPWPIVWALCWIVLAVGLPQLLVARLLLSVYDTQATLVARALQAIPTAFKDTLKTFGANLPEGERDANVSRWSYVSLGRENGTMMTFVAGGLELAVSITGLGGMVMAFAGPVTAAGVIGVFLVLLNIVKALIVMAAESIVRERLRVHDKAVGKREEAYRATRQRRSFAMAMTCGVLAGIVAVGAISTLGVGTATVVVQGAEAAEQAERDEAAIRTWQKSCAHDRKVQAEYEKDGQYKYCTDFPDEPLCNGGCDNF